MASLLSRIFVYGLLAGGVTAQAEPRALRVATFNVALNRSTAGGLLAELRGGESEQARAVAAIIQRTRPDVLLLNEFDWDDQGEALACFVQTYLGRGQHGEVPIEYPHRFAAAVNTGVPTGLDLDRDGTTDGPGDAFGFGTFAGQYGMAVLSRLPIARAQVRTFQKLRWRDMPDARWPEDWYSDEAKALLRLSSKSHWDVPLAFGDSTLHLLTSHPTPPVFDGPEDRNGRRNADEIRFWADYVDPTRSAWIRDDAGQSGGLAADARFVIVGDLNADPMDGDSLEGAIAQLLAHPRIDATAVPTSTGGADAAKRQGGANAKHRGDPTADTGDFTDARVGNLRLDYVLPSRNLRRLRQGVFWPTATDPTFALVGGGKDVVSSDHRLVWLDVEAPPLPDLPAREPFGELRDVRFLTPFAFAEHELTLVRWWTDTCPFCADSLPALEGLRERFGSAGFAVLAMYHPKPPRAVPDAAVAAHAERLGFRGPLAIDANWRKLADLQARGAPRRATSISVLVDRAGEIVWTHPGPRLHAGSAHPEAARAYDELRALLADRLR